MTLAQYFETPESVTPQELIYGHIRVAESPSSIHQHAVGALFVALHAHVTTEGRGEVWLAPLDVVLDVRAPLVVQPDLFVILNGGAATVLRKVFGPPDLVVEVLSPHPRIGDTDERVRWFRDHGVRECWLVHQVSKRVEVLRFEGRRVLSQKTHEATEVIQSGVLPEFGRTLGSMVGYDV